MLQTSGLIRFRCFSGLIFIFNWLVIFIYLFIWSCICRKRFLWKFCPVLVVSFALFCKYIFKYKNLVTLPKALKYCEIFSYFTEKGLVYFLDFLWFCRPRNKFRIIRYVFDNELHWQLLDPVPNSITIVCYSGGHNWGNFCIGSFLVFSMYMFF